MVATGKLFILSAPSGAGKTTILKKVMAKIGGLVFSVSHTTRSPRSAEENGVDYHFVSTDEFEDMRAQDLFLEWAEVHGNFYGTSRLAVLNQLTMGQDVILDIDVQGAGIIRKNDSIAAVSIFVAPPSIAELERRLRGRGTDSSETINLRLQNAVKEMESASGYDYLVINDELEQAAATLQAVIIAERSRGHRLPTGEPIMLVTDR
ncbi:MAG: guanylate kinase [Desulfocapsa sp.]|nr:guanylate kinase [Desulfocapsa sp.]